MTAEGRIIRNTLLLYARMSLLILIGLYTTRITLQALGIQDFGIYNAVAGILLLFSFLNSALTASVQRFLNYYIGKKDEVRSRMVFSQGFWCYIILCALILLLMETVGRYFLFDNLVIPKERIESAFGVFQCVVISTIFSVARIPFNAIIIAYEDMRFFSYMGIVEGVAKLSTAEILLHTFGDKLIIYGIIISVISAIMCLGYYIYAKKNYSIVNMNFLYDKDILRGMLSFSGWNIVGSAAGMACNYGIIILINMFFGVIASAAIGLANQVNNIIYSFLGNFQMAFNPYIVKLYATEQYQAAYQFSIKASKYSFFLLLLIILPFWINMEYVLGLWLKEVPVDTVLLLKYLCIFTLLDALSGPFWMLVEAQGDIKYYQQIGTISGLGIIIGAYIAYTIGGPMYSGLLIRNIGTAIFMIWRLWYLRQKIDFPVKAYIKETIKPCGIIVILSMLISALVRTMSLPTIPSLIFTCLCADGGLLLLYYFIGLSQMDKTDFMRALKRR